jgi:hypothetical protein
MIIKAEIQDQYYKMSEKIYQSVMDSNLSLSFEQFARAVKDNLEMQCSVNASTGYIPQ